LRLKKGSEYRERERETERERERGRIEIRGCGERQGKNWRS